MSINAEPSGKHSLPIEINVDDMLATNKSDSNTSPQGLINHA